MVELNDNTIDKYITNAINLLEPNTLKEKVTAEYDALVMAQNNHTQAKFIDCVHIYFFGVCLLYNIGEKSEIIKEIDVKKYGDIYFTILSTINNYLYKKQYDAESKILNYVPASKKWLNQELNINTAGTKNIILLPEYNFDNTPPDSLYIPKLDKEITTTPKLLKTTGLINPEIAKIINDGQFTNVTAFKLKNFSLNNQFIVRHRATKFIEINNSDADNSYNNIAFYKIDNLNKYYLLFFKKKNDSIFATALLLNAITHIDFQPGYLTTLETELNRTGRKERYIYTFGLFKSFVLSDTISFIGSEHRCALVYDTLDKRIYYIDSEFNKNTILYNPSKVQEYYNSIDITIRYLFAENNILNGYKVYISKLNLQGYDIYLSKYINQSAYHRINAGQPQFDWTGGYCGTYILMFLIIIVLNPDVPIEQIIYFFYIISNDINKPKDKEKAGFAAHTLLLLMVRSFAKQIETHMTYSNFKLEFDKLNVTEYINRKKVIVETEEVPLIEGAQPNYRADPRINNRLTAQMFRKDNVNKPQNVKIQHVVFTRIFTLLGDMFKRIDKIQTKLTPAQFRWQIENYGLGDSIYFINY